MISPLSRNILLFVVSALFFPAPNFANEYNSFFTVNYRIPYSNWDEYAQDTRRFAERMVVYVEQTENPKTHASAYYELGKLFEVYLGHHHLTIQFYQRALDIAPRSKLEKESPGTITDIHKRLDRLTAMRFQALTDTVVPEAPVVNPHLYAVPITQGDEDRARENLEMWKKTLIPPEGSLEIPPRSHFQIIHDAEKALERAINPLRPIYDIIDGRLVICPGVTTFKKNDAWCTIHPKYLQGIIIEPPGYRIHWVHGTATFKDTKAPGWMRLLPGVKNAVENHTRVIKSWRLKPVDFSIDSTFHYSAYDRLQMFDLFLEEHPQYRERAAPFIDDLNFFYATELDTIKAYNEYITNYPAGRNGLKATLAIEEKYYHNAESEGTKVAYTKYLNKYPDGIFAEEAAFKVAKSDRSSEAYEKFLSKYPEGRFSDEVGFRIAQLKNTEEGYQAFLRRHPHGEYSVKAQEFIKRRKELQAYQQARKTDTEISYGKFLVEYPTALQKEEAQSRLLLKRVLVSPSLENFQDYYASYLDRAISASESQTVANLLDGYAAKNPSSTVYLLLYEQTSNLDALENAIKEIQDVDDEYAIIKAAPRLFFDIEIEGKKFAIDGYQGYSKVTSSFEPLYSLTFGSRASLGIYQIDVRLEIKIIYTREWYGIRDLGAKLFSLPKEMVNYEAATRTIVLDPQGAAEANFDFSRVYSSEERYMISGGKKVTASVQMNNIEIISVDLKQ